ncbi:hypothetical protein [Agromyces humi]|uniref:hypothetical protein n=1 Tax=Agromyces humi TaxID=1766800 RepID=UPI0013584CAB|nr:hypothetical protein [Agromyces humi]
MTTTSVTTSATISKVVELPTKASVIFTLVGPAAKAFADWAKTSTHVKTLEISRTSGRFKTKAGQLRGLSPRLEALGFSMEDASPSVRVTKKAAGGLERTILASAIDEARESASRYLADGYELGAAHVDEEFASTGNVWVRPNKKPATVKVVASIIVTSTITPIQ